MGPILRHADIARKPWLWRVKGYGNWHEVPAVHFALLIVGYDLLYRAMFRHLPLTLTRVLQRVREVGRADQGGSLVVVQADKFNYCIGPGGRNHKRSDFGLQHAACLGCIYNSVGNVPMLCTWIGSRTLQCQNPWLRRRAQVHQISLKPLNTKLNPGSLAGPNSCGQSVALAIL